MAPGGPAYHYAASAVTSGQPDYFNIKSLDMEKEAELTTVHAPPVATAFSSDYSAQESKLLRSVERDGKAEAVEHQMESKDKEPAPAQYTAHSEEWTEAMHKRVEIRVQQAKDDMLAKSNMEIENIRERA